MKERTKLIYIILIFAASYYVPWDNPTIRQSGLEAFMMLQEYAWEHVLTCLIPAFFIAGAIAVFVSQASVLKYFGAQASKLLSYSVVLHAIALLICPLDIVPKTCFKTNGCKCSTGVKGFEQLYGRIINRTCSCISSKNGEHPLNMLG